MKKDYVRTIGISILLIAIVAAGYSTFIYFMKTVVPSFSSYGLFIVAVVAGISMFFNPCSFTLLPTFLTFFATKSELREEKKLGTFLLYGLSASLGIVTFSLILGGAIGLLGAGFGRSFALGGDAPNVYVRLFRGIVGGLLAFFGILHFKGVSFRTGPFNKISQALMSPSKRGPLLGMYLYGFGYNALGIGCGGPIMAALLVFAVSVGGFRSALIAFILFSLTMVVLMLLISILVGLSRDTLVTKLKSSSGTIKKFTGIILFAVGFFLLLSAVFTRTFVGILFPGG